ncbi:MAG: DinB family protein [Rhodanobacter sp.]
MPIMREKALLHVVTHGVDHRGQISALMLHDARTPAPDGFTRYLHLAEASARGRAAA